MKVVYVAGPFRGRNAWYLEQNVRRAESLAREAWLAGAAVICPHANTRFFHGSGPDSIYLEGDLEILRRCDAVLLTPDWESSTGARAEVLRARELGLKVLYDIKELEVWLKQFS